MAHVYRPPPPRNRARDRTRRAGTLGPFSGVPSFDPRLFDPDIFHVFPIEVQVIDETVEVQETTIALVLDVKVIDETIEIRETLATFELVLQVIDETIEIRETLVNSEQVLKIINEQVRVVEIVGRARDFLDELSALFYWHAEYGVAAVKGGDAVFDRGSSGWAKDQRGTWIELLTDTLRFTWRAVRGAMKQLVAVTEDAATNKAQRNVDYGANGLTDWPSVSGDAVLSNVDDAAELRKAGLHLLVPDGEVLKLDAIGASSESSLDAPGTTGNTSDHVPSVFWRGGGQARVRLSNAAGVTQNQSLPSSYERYDPGPVTPDDSSRQWQIVVAPGSIVYFVLAQLEEGDAVTTPIRNPTAGSVTRAGDWLYYDDAPPPIPHLAVYASVVLARDADAYPGSERIWAMSDTAPRMFTYLDASSQVRFRLAQNGATHEATLSISGAVEGDHVETLAWYEPDGSVHLVLATNGGSASHNASGTTATIPQRWGDERIAVSAAVDGSEKAWLEPATVKVLKRAHLSQAHVDGSDWDSLLGQARSLVLGPGGALKGGVAR